MKPWKSSLARTVVAFSATLLLAAGPLAAQEAGDTARVDAPATQDFSTLGTFTLPADGSVTLEFDVMVNPTIPAGVGAVINQGAVLHDQTAVPLPSDDPTTGTADDPTLTLLLVEAELGVTKTDNPASATAVPGTQIQYDVVVSNAGPFGALDVPVTDTFPAALTNCTWSCGGTGNCDAANGVGDVNTTVDLEAGQSVTFVITCDIDPAATTTLINTAAATTPAGVSDPGNVANSDDDVNTLTPQGDLSLTKVTTTSPVIPGAAIQYQVTVANSGPSDAVGVDVDDTFPAAVTGVTWTCAGAGGAACPNGAGAGDLAETVDLPAGGSLTYTVDGTVDAGAAGSIANTATLTVPGGFTDTNPGNESDTVTDTLNPEGDVAVTKTTLTSPVVPGAAVQYQVQVTNPGPSDALGVILTDTFPAAVTGVTWTCTASAGSACSAASGNGDLNESIDVAAGSTVTYTVTGTVNAAASGNLSNTATVTPPAGFADGSTGNDDSTVTDALEPQGNLVVTKTTLTSPVVAGLPVGYEVTVTNSGPSLATGAQVQDNFAADLSNESWTCVASAGAACTAAGNGDILDAVTLPAGSSVTYSITADLAAGAVGPLGNTATVTPPAGFTDTNNADDSDTVSDAVAQQADLILVKDDGGGAVNGVITYTITLTNAGPGDVTGAAVSDTFPAGLTDVEWTCVGSGGATCTAGPVSGDINDSADLPANSMVVYTATATVDTDDPVTNGASVTLPAGVVDPNPDDNDDEVVTDFASILEIPTLSQAGLVLLVLLLAGLALVRLRRRTVVGLVLALALLGAGAADAQVLVDDFSTAQVLTQDPPGGPPPQTSLADGAGIVGGERDLALRLISGAGPVTGEVTGGQFDFDAPAGSRGEAELTWDGNDDDATALDPTGLGGVDLTGGGALSGFRFTIDQAAADLELILRVYTDGANHSQAGRLITTAINSATPVFIPFSELRPVAGAGADPGNVGAVVLVVRGENATLLLDRLEALGPDLTITKVDLNPNTNTELGNTPVTAGSTIRYRITLQNQGGTATTVDVNDVVDSNTTLLPNTLNSTPVAVGDAYRWFGNVTLDVDGGAFPGLLANDTDPDGDPVTVTAFDSPTARGGTVSGLDINTGTFTYEPPAGVRGVDSFTYQIQDDDGNASTATVTIQLEQVVWFVDSSHCSPAPCGTGTQADPFGALAQAEAASGPGDVIRLRQGNDDAEELARHNAGIQLKDGQRLIGEGVDLILSGLHVEGLGAADANLDPNAANRPRITHAGGGNGLTLANNLEILGLDVVGSDDSAVFGSNVDAVTLNHVAVVDSGGAALELLNATNMNLTFTGLDSLNSFEHAVHLDGVSGLLTVNGPTQLDDPAQSGIRIENSPGLTAGFNAVTVTDSGGGAPHAALHLESNGGAVLTFGTLNLDSANGDGFFALDGGTVNHPSSGNVVNAAGGAAVDIQTTTGNAGGSPGWSFDGLTSTSSPDEGVRLAGLAQDFNVGAGGTTVTDADTVGIVVQGSAAGTDFDFGDTSVTDSNVGAGATANGIDLSGGNANSTFTFDSLNVVTDGGYGLFTNNTGTVSIAGTDGNQIVATGGAALTVTSTGIGAPGWTFDTLSSSASPTFGVNLVGLTGGNITGESGLITGSGGTAFNVDGGAPTVLYSGSVTQNNAQRVVNVEDTTGGSVTFDTGTVTGGAASLGVRVNNAGGNASFAHLDLGTSGSPMGSQGITLGGASTGTFTFADTQVFTSGANGVHATDGGVVEFTGAGNRVSATNGRALTFDGGTTIGPNGATFERLDASGADRGIRLVGAGSGFTVTGTGATDGSGGVLQNIAQRGIEAIQTDVLALSNMTLTNANQNDGAASNGTSGGNENTDENGAIHLENLSTVDLTNVDINGAAQHGVNGNLVTDLDIAGSVIQNTGNGVWESGVYLFQLRGTQAAGSDSVFSNSTITNTGQFNVFVRNNGATNAAPGAMDRLELNTMTFQNSGASVAGDHVTVSNRDTANFQTVVTGSSFTATAGNTSDSIQVDAGDTSRSDVAISGSTFVDGNLAINISGSGTATTTFDVSGNPSISSRGSSGVNIAANASSSMTGTVANNPSITSNFANNNGFGVDVVVDQTGSAVVDIDGNTFTNLAVGIRAGARNAGTGTADVTIRNNNISTGGNFAFNAVQVFAGNGAGGESNRTCINFVNNTTATGFGDDEYFLEQYTGNTFQLQGLTPASGATQTQVEAFVEGTDTGTPTADAFGGTIVNYTAATCATP